jgi:hypothetical protein
MKFLVTTFLLLFSLGLSAQNQSTTEWLYKYIQFGKDSGQVSVKTIIGKDTSVQATSSLNVKNLAAEKSAQKAEVLKLLQQIEKEYDMLMDIFFNVRSEEEKYKKVKK